MMTGEITPGVEFWLDWLILCAVFLLLSALAISINARREASRARQRPAPPPVEVWRHDDAA